MSFRALLIGASALLLLLPAALTAQRIPSPYQFVEETQAVGLFAGWVLADPGALELGGIDGPTLGVRYGIRLNGPFTVEGEASYLSLSRAVVDTALVLPDSTFAVVDTAGLDLVLLNAALRFDLTGSRTWRGFMPFFTALAGAAVDLSGDDPADQAVPVEARYDYGTSFSGGLGAGVEWFPTRRLTVRADVRDILWKVVTPEPLLGIDLRAPDEEWVQNIIISVGGSVRF